MDGTQRPVESPSSAPFVETPHDETIPHELLRQRICDFDLHIDGGPLEPIVQTMRAELAGRGITRVAPSFYLTNEWGVPEGTVAIGIPFYLADERLVQVHRLRNGLVEGTSPDDILRYLRHEMGHVLNYAYALYERKDWTDLFGPMSRPYRDHYRAVPFSPDFVRHLPGAYAQKHPDEDWAETFAVWMTPGSDWRSLYRDCPGALAKLEGCDRIIGEVRERAPLISDAACDLDVKEISATIQEWYPFEEMPDTTLGSSLDGDLQAIFDPMPAAAEQEGKPPLGNAAALLRENEDLLCNAVYRWTGVDPGYVKPLVRQLGRRAEAMRLRYTLGERDALLVQLTALLTTLAMNYLCRGEFLGK